MTTRPTEAIERRAEEIDAQVRNVVANATTSEDIRRMMMVLRGATKATKLVGPASCQIDAPDWPTRLAAVKLHMSYLAAPVLATQRLEVSRGDGPTVEDQLRALQTAGTDIAGIVSSWISSADPALREKAVDIQAVVDI